MYILDGVQTDGSQFTSDFNTAACSGLSFCDLSVFFLVLGWKVNMCHGFSFSQEHVLDLCALKKKGIEKYRQQKKTKNERVRRPHLA